ncbi:AAA domain-containing protein [Nocardia sp. NPDC051832]|uniref:bifunctional RecB family nuclease/DEAD/DEAH box helicase n=1 Tax=Nocardia sp. NPDC051832 TaxID=3155673 RepID=UPI003434EFF3
MFGDRVVCTAVDLVRAARCEFELLRRLDAQLGYLSGSATADSEPATLGGVAADFDAAALLRLADFRDRFGAAMVEVPSARTEPARSSDPQAVAPAPDPALRVAALRAAHSETVAALRSGVHVIAGATFFDGSFACSCDFLVRAGHRVRYTVQGTAPGQAEMVGAALELAACADALDGSGALTAPTIRLYLDTAATDFPLTDLVPVYQARRRRLARILDEKLSELLPVQWGDPRYLACGHCATCTTALTAARDLMLVAGMPSPARARLREAGVATIDRLAGLDTTVPGLPPRTFAMLRRQARTQLQPADSGRPAHTLLDALALGALPPAAPGDLALTLEETPGQSLRIEVAGIAATRRPVEVPVGSDAEEMPGRWASRAEVAGVDAARSSFEVPVGSDAEEMPGRWASRAEAAGITATRSSFEVPVGSDVEKGSGRRVSRAGVGGAVLLSFEVPPGPDAVAERRRALTEVVEYLVRRRQQYPAMRVYHYRREVRDALVRCAGSLGAGEELVEELLTAGVLVDLYPIVRSAVVVGTQSYRIDALRQLLDGVEADERDCVTVLRLRDWLLERAADVRPDNPAPPVDRAGGRPSSLEAALTEFAATHRELRPTVRGERRDDRATPHPAALMAAVLGYHRRERQPLRLAHADRLDHPVDEWAEDPGVLVAEWGTVDTKWHHSLNRPTMRRYLTLTGRIGTGWAHGVALTPGTTVYTLYDQPMAAGVVTGVGKRATATATVLGCSVDANFDDTVRLEELLPEGCEPYDDLPTAIAPGLPAWDANIERTVELAAQQLLVTLPEIPCEAVFDILARRAPRLRGGGGLPEVHGDHAAAITTAMRYLDHSYIAVQGPSGTGMTSTAARVIERLVTRQKWRIGVVAQAHSTVENMLDAVVEIGVLPELVGKKDVEAVKPEWAVIDAGKYRRFLDNAVNGCVIGGTPADFADENLIPHDALDLLVIADAGGFALADTVAVGSSARNLLLLGDPVPTATRGAHPEPVGESVLGWLAEGRAVLPAERGYFLDRTWRLPPRVCEPISRVCYDNRLRSNETVTLARQLDGVPPGVETVLVEHYGNTTESVAEAKEVVRRIRVLLGASWTVGAVTRRLHPHDIFVVAPYSAQVGRIRTLLARAKIEDVLVGTPDRFRGREAAVVLLSMTTSTPADAPFGMPFLISRRLIHSALCRAMWKAEIIRSPLLTEYLPTTPTDLPALAGFLRLS